jgi:hypothetical protein
MDDAAACGLRLVKGRWVWRNRTSHRPYFQAVPSPFRCLDRIDEAVIERPEILGAVKGRKDNGQSLPGDTKKGTARKVLRCARGGG